MSASPNPALSGRIDPTPAELIHDEVLDPQFRYEMRYLLPGYVDIEKVLLTEYLRMGLLDAGAAGAIGRLLDRLDERTVAARPDANLSDPAFAIERYVEEHLDRPAPQWHVDRSRNDLQACCQLRFGLARLAQSALALLDFGATVRTVAERTLDLPMPGYTHYQAAQVITPGFHLTALAGQVSHFGQRMLAVYDATDYCPLGSGAMSGQELAWDREAMARLLGFAAPRASALGSVASRSWVLEILAELALAGAELSRFATDLLNWGSSEYGFIDLPDEMSGISSAMPQKKNFPVLERIRGRTAHLAGFQFGAMLGQRNTPFTNLVEVSKEAGTHLVDAFDTFDSALRLFTAVVAAVRFRPDRMRAACEAEFLGGFSLANELTRTRGVPWRTAQVIAGRYITTAVDAGLAPAKTDAGLLVSAAAEHGVVLAAPDQALAEAFDVDKALRRLSSAGSAHPAAVRAVLADLERDEAVLRAQWQRRRDRVSQGAAEVAALLGLDDPEGGP